MKKALKIVDEMTQDRIAALRQADTPEREQTIRTQMRTLSAVKARLGMYDQGEKYLKALKKGPEWVYNSMDGSLFIRTLTKPEPGEVFEKDGNRFVVAYAWHWTTYNGTPVYMAELDSETDPRRPKKEKQ